jgi:hypothetical protein
MRWAPPLLATVLLATLLPVATRATADDDGGRRLWVDRPLVLPPLHLALDAGVGFGQFGVVTNPQCFAACPLSVDEHLGFGSSLEVALGLPLGFELGVRTGIRFGDGKIANPDHYARLFDRETVDAGFDTMANPELRLRSSVIAAGVAQIAAELRVDVPFARDTSAGITSGIPLRLAAPGILRVDTGIYFPYYVTNTTNVPNAPGATAASALDDYWALTVPVQVWLQMADAFVGPISGIRFNRFDSAEAVTDIPAGIGGGYTIAKMLDIKAQVLTSRLNDASWTRYIGAGVGVGLLVP